jgi:hypothetical protein
MTLLSVADFKLHLSGNVTTDDAALQDLLDAAEAAIEDRYGPIGTISETHQGTGRLMGLDRKAQAILSVSERGVALDASDYRLRPSGGIVERLSTGTHPSLRWRGQIEVTLLSFDNTAERIRIQIGLVKLDMSYTPGVGSHSIGNFSESSSQQQGITYAQLREEYLSSLEAVGWLR